MFSISTILIVDDSVADVLLLKMALKRNHFEGHIESVGTTDLAYQWLMGRLDSEDTLPELILLDLGLPGESGLEMLEKLKSNPVLSPMKVIVFSGSSRPQDIVRARHLGAAWYFVKKSEPKDLNFIVKELARICQEPSSWESGAE